MKLLHRTWKQLEPSERRRYLWLSAADALVHVLDIAFLAGLLALVQRLLQGGGTLPLGLSPAFALPAFFVAFLLKNWAGLGVTHALYALAGRVALRIAGRQLEACQRSGHDEFIKTGSPVLIRKINFHPLEFAHYLLLGFQQIATQLLLVAFSIAAVLLFDAGLFLLLLAVLLPPSYWLFRSIRRRIDQNKEVIRSSNEESLRYLLDALQGQPEAKVYGRRSFFKQRYLAARGRFSEAYFGMMGIQQVPARALETVAVLGLLVLLGLSLRNGDAGAYGLVRAGAFLAAAYKVIPGLVRIIGAVGQLKAWSFTLEETQVPPAEPAAVGRIHSLWVNGLGYAYGNKPLFEGFSFQAGAGDLLLLESPSGSGKTTLLHLLLGFLQVQEGTILVNNSVLTPANAAAFWPRMAYVRQQAFLIHDSIERNITLEERTLHPARLELVLRATGLQRMLSAAGAGPEKIVLENGRNLSGGQQQRIALARALYRDADLYLLDEPFNELDLAAIGELQELLQAEAAAGKIVIVVTHQPETIPGARRVRIYDTSPQTLAAAHARLCRVGSR